MATEARAIPVNRATATVPTKTRPTGDAVVIGRTSITPPYTGSYEVTPATFEIELQTKGFRMTNNVSVLEIPYYETTNESGGYTVIIG